ncbi:MAG: hypothetical protein AAF195_02205, partial [Pseudomonadota bacterium]
ITILTLFFIFLTMGNITYACQCEEIEYKDKENRITNEFLNSDAVFVGKVTKISSSSQQDIVHFDIIGSWKGVEYNTHTLVTNLEAWGCDYEFYEGLTYIVFANKVKQEVKQTNRSFGYYNRNRYSSSREKISASICSLTSDADSDLIRQYTLKLGNPQILPEKPTNRYGNRYYRYR